MARCQFGVFDFATETGQLRRDGLPVRLQAQPAQVLAVLLANQGQIVTRETLRTAIWGSGTFVDFDRGLNFCIAQIRSALGDSADAPRYVRTFPKKGYQFIAPVTFLSDPASAPPKPMEPASEEVLAVPPPTIPRRQARAFLPLTLALLAVIVAWQTWHDWQTQNVVAIPAPQSTIPAVAVFRLDNNTGNPDYDRLADVLTDSLIAELTESGTASIAEVPQQPSRAYAVIGNAAALRRPRAMRDLLAIGTDLKTPWTISGSIRSTDGTTVTGIEVFAQLVTIPDGKHVKVVRLSLPPNALKAPPVDVPRSMAATFHPYLASLTPVRK